MNFLRFLQLESPNTLLGGRYKVLKQLGAGGFGQTFLAEDLHLPGNPHCVVKRLQPQFSDPAALQTAKRLFDTEAQTLYALGNHNQIPKLLAHFEQNQEFYLVQELVVGHCLSQEVKNGHPWSEAQVVGLMRDILEVLAFVHQQNVIHRDIKPDNLIRRHADGKIVLIDFGAVKQATTQLLNTAAQSRLTIAIGTPGYMPNEQLAGNPRFSSDIFAVGMIGIHALTGISPRSLPQNPQTSEIEWQDRVAKANSEVNSDLAAVLNKMVRYDFRARYSTAAEALTAIDQVPIAAEPPPLTAPPATASGSSVASFVPVGTTAPLPVTQARSLTSGASGEIPATAPLSQNATLPISPMTMTARAGQLKQFARSQPKKMGLFAAGVVGSVLLVSLVKPLFSPRPASDSAETVNTASPASSPASPSPAASSDPQTQATPLLAQADKLREQNQFQQAVQTYDQAIALDPNAPEAHWGRCYSLNTLEQFANAITACDRALKLNPGYAEALWSKGYALDRQGQDQAALTLYEQAIDRKPNFAQAWSNKGTALIQLNRPSEALAAFDRAIELDSSLAEAWNNRGAALWSLRRFEEALASVERATQIQPNYPDALSLQQQMRQKLGK
ncbi:serine/threonine-protein kinase [Leptolyngbya sp. FACHB-711]|uniref:protein kinase domain-containing protein n=1 Tax=unclassified Leptolyngbya TaxID=2650499 RepID=UPI001689ADCE|nr:tetratricopeptide repeat protein [Cyanobacteria bacterium FACHB-502]MBD2025293.1 tetratricopeptide repeat protein [Leptolyngbya sp. FACHB-711]